jgi:YidC/Oxa1 family membrane protein insertase
MQSPDQMHPQDRRNLILFAVIAISMWVGYDFLIARPHAEAMRQAAQVAAANRAAIESSAPSEILDTAIVKPRPEIIAETKRVAFENELATGSINLKGARLDDLVLKDYHKTVEAKDQVTVLSPARTPFPRYVETGWIGQNVEGLPDTDTMWSVKGNDKLTPETPVTLTYAAPNNIRFEKTISVTDDFAFTIVNKVINNSAASIKLYPYALVTEHGLPEDFLNLGAVHEGPIGYIGENLEERDYKDFKKKNEEVITAAMGWVGITGKYWLTTVAPADQQNDHRFRFVKSPAINEATKDRYQADYTGPEATIAAGTEASSTSYVYSGAKKLALLSKYENEWNIPHFDLAVDFGWFYFLTKPFFLALNFLYGLTGNFGIAIIIFTCVLRIFVFPLANTSYKSFAKMRKVSPEMYELRAKYKDDKQTLQRELVALYQKHNVNPMAGCLPIVVQIPIFFALYKVLSNTIEMRHAPFYGWIKDLSEKDPTTIFNLFGLIPWTPPSFLMIGALPLIMLVSMIVQRNISPPPEDPIQARIIGMMPYFMTFIMAGFASGLVLYWTVNNILAIIQQVVIMKSMGVPVQLFNKGAIEKKLEKEIKDGPVIHPEFQVAEEQIEKAILGDDKPTKPITPATPKKKKKK